MEQSNKKARKDVVYKTLLRSIRRFFVRKFRFENPRFYLKNKVPYKNSVYENAVKKFCANHFADAPDPECLFYYIVALIRQEWYVGIENIPSNIVNTVGNIYSCFYKFKLWQFESLAADKNIQYLFDKMMSFGVEKIIRLEKSMNDKRAVYLEAFKEFKRLGELDIYSTKQS